MIKALKATREWPKFNSGCDSYQWSGANQGQFIRSCTRAPVKLSNLIGNYFNIFSPHKHLSLSARVSNTNQRERRTWEGNKLSCAHPNTSQCIPINWTAVDDCITSIWHLLLFSLIVHLMTVSRSFTVTASFWFICVYHVFSICKMYKVFVFVVLLYFLYNRGAFFFFDRQFDDCIKIFHCHCFFRPCPSWGQATILIENQTIIIFFTINMHIILNN